ncbi:BREX-2 system adenine-specific DNA-methyltransferase PglX [Jatrophihabitans sp.]|uniref:BREX-2 system adenine-specific DNA-methyltransferase PglX n=1 Tax=Jatrophihabitans sp. TaxID=1932789 RepID=UPI002C028A05|nr:BREX-2 system adenine-specific DNA-methyltransferase PglX [Jatrophihabitans sp.]
MTISNDLTTQLRTEVLWLENDLRARLEALPERKTAWEDEHNRAVSRGRTAAAWESWRDERITQVAVAWVLATVFVRFCEDNDLVHGLWLAGTGTRLQQAVESQNAFLLEKARTRDVTDTDWILDAVEHLAGLRATASLVARENPLRLLPISGDAAERLIAFWRARDDEGNLLRNFTDPEWDSRFLGDLYQDLSESARKKFALLQTPVFVEEFILDRTLEPALAERPLEGFKAIDPACGSGHFLLGIFARLLDRWHRAAPGMDERARVQKALDSVYGVDLNPFAVAIARFRLTLAALKASGETSLENAPAFKYHLAVGDSLLFGYGQAELQGVHDYHDFAYTTEDRDLLESILADGQYDAVVANPPYITVKDSALNAKYRWRYSSCKGTYALSIPFMEKLFALAKAGEPAGWVGQITSNSFMKREFGSKLIEEFFPEVDLLYVINSEGAWIPGHNTDGTPTAILVGRNRRPAASTLRAVLSNGRRETRTVGDDGDGPYWQALVGHLDDPSYTDDWVSVTDLDRAVLARHPWSLSGGGAVELKAAIEASAARRLSAAIEGQVGFASFPGADDAFFAPEHALLRDDVPASLIRAVLAGDVVRDWEVRLDEFALVPYDTHADLVQLDMDSWGRRQWPQRTVLGGVTGFGGETRADAGTPWWGWYRWVASRYRTPLSITFAEVATHNHFVLDYGKKVFKQTAPVIKLPPGATQEQHHSLLTALNSSVVCFWLKEKCQPKGGAAGTFWARTYQFNGSNVEDIPLPAQPDAFWGQRMTALIECANASSPEQAVSNGLLSRPELDERRSVYEERRRIAISCQEDLDWAMYRAYGLIDEDLTWEPNLDMAISLGQRAFEIVLARKIAAGEAETAWFDGHNSTPITELPAEWPAEYRKLVERRIELIETNPFIGLLERPEYKRRWMSESWEVREKRALAGWLLDRLEGRKFWFDPQGRPVTRSVQQLADELGRDTEFTDVLDVWAGRPGIPVVTSLATLTADESVPFLAAYRYKDSGLRTRAAWERTWELQRQEDAGMTLRTPIPVPPKYTSADFVKPSYWTQRGKLDVPKERFILYPNAGRETDPTLVLGWAGWDHAQQSLALATLLQQRSDEGASDERLVPLVAGLAELLPWVKQWHHDLDPMYGDSPAAFFTEQLAQWSFRVGATAADLSAWQPKAPTRGRRGRKATS